MVKKQLWPLVLPGKSNEGWTW